MTTANNMNTNFKFRTKFKKLLNDENRSAITSAFEKFCSFDSDDAIQVLWRMTYSKDKALEEVYKLGLDSKLVSSENVLNLRNELRYQYEQCVQPEFLQFYRDNGEDVDSAFLKLKECTDGIVASIVYDVCGITLEKSEEEIQRTLGLLRHSKENYYFGGIRSMNFNMEETEYLKPYHMEIHNLLEAMNDFIPFYLEEEEERALEERELEDFFKENVVKVEETETFEEAREESKPIEEETAEFFQETEEVKATTVTFKTVTPGEIIANKDIFKLFAESDDLNMLLPIGNLGFDLNQVMIKKEEIHSFIIAYEALIK